MLPFTALVPRSTPRSNGAPLSTRSSRPDDKSENIPNVPESVRQSNWDNCCLPCRQFIIPLTIIQHYTAQTAIEHFDGLVVTRIDCSLFSGKQRRRTEPHSRFAQIFAATFVALHEFDRISLPNDC